MGAATRKPPLELWTHTHTHVLYIYIYIHMYSNTRNIQSPNWDCFPNRFRRAGFAQIFWGSMVSLCPQIFRSPADHLLIFTCQWIPKPNGCKSSFPTTAMCLDCICHIYIYRNVFEFRLEQESHIYIYVYNYIYDYIWWRSHVSKLCWISPYNLYIENLSIYI